MTSLADRSGAAMLRLSIVIVNWNGGQLLHRCIESIVRFPPAIPFEILIVDNGSTDNSLQEVERRPWPATTLSFIRNDVNVGFGRANNQAIARTDSELLLLLNPDTEVTSGAIDTLIRTGISDEQIGACGPRLVNSDGSLQHSAWHNPSAAWQILLSGTGLWRLLPRRLRGDLLLGGHWDHSTPRVVPMLFGAAILVKRRVIENVGAFDERFHMYAEDNELCLRITRAGWRIVFEPAATVVHHGGQLANRRWTDEDRLRVKTRAYLEFQRLAMSRARVVTNLLAACFAAGTQWLWRVLRGQEASDARIIFGLHAADLKNAFRLGSHSRSR